MRYSKLRKLAATVRSGDVSNNEGVAARIYFDVLLGDATRRQSMWHNSALNYAYAIVRGTIARSVASRGSLLSLASTIIQSSINTIWLMILLRVSARWLMIMFCQNRPSPSG